MEHAPVETVAAQSCKKRPIFRYIIHGSVDVRVLASAGRTTFLTARNASPKLSAATISMVAFMFNLGREVMPSDTLYTRIL